MSIGTARSLPLELAAPKRRQRAVLVDPAAALSRREATLRAAATTCLAGIALVQAIELPSLFAQGGQFAALSLAGMVVCVGLGLALAATPAGAGRHLWRMVAATAVVMLAAWAAPRAIAIPGLAHHRGHWTATPGAACSALAAVCLALSVAAVRPTRAAARGLATALAVVVALGPGVGALLVALGPGLAGGETSLAAGVHVHSSHGLDESLIRFQPIPGGNGGHYVYRAAAPARQTALGVALLAAAALVFTSGAVSHLRGRSAPDEPVPRAGVDAGPA